MVIRRRMMARGKSDVATRRHDLVGPDKRNACEGESHVENMSSRLRLRRSGAHSVCDMVDRQACCGHVVTLRYSHTSSNTLCVPSMSFDACAPITLAC